MRDGRAKARQRGGAKRKPSWQGVKGESPSTRGSEAKTELAGRKVESPSTRGSEAKTELAGRKVESPSTRGSEAEPKNKERRKLDMIELQGKSVLQDIAIGPLFFYENRSGEVVRRPVMDCEEEFQRYEKAVEEAGRQLEQLYERSCQTVGQANAEIFQVQKLLLLDEKYRTSVQQMIFHLQMNVEYAVFLTGSNMAQMLKSVEDEYIRERSQDIEDITERLLQNLSGEEGMPELPEEPFILAAEDLLPSATVRLDKKKVLGFALAKGGLNSHTALLAKNMGIPALMNLGEALSSAYNREEAVLDGEAGRLYIKPEKELLQRMQQKKEEKRKYRERLQTLRGKEDVTRDGRRMKVYANAGCLADIDSALENDATGIGLFRSEMLYLEQKEEPTEEFLFAYYRDILKKMPDKEVIIRTFDIGADKKADWLQVPGEENPALGMRAIRLSWLYPNMLVTQLKALYRAGLYGKLSIFYPMITSCEELEYLKKLENQAKEELQRAGVPFAEQIPRGIMIETPAAAILSRELAEKVDFFSVGTNDLTQYTLAMDRQNPLLEPFGDAENRAVLRLVEYAAESAHKAGIPIGICGDLAADTELTEAFLKWGIDELSVPAGMVLKIREKIREL